MVVQAEATEDKRDQSSSMTYDEEELEKSRAFMMALQELKNLQPQLYQAADYCEQTYLSSDHKQGVLDNIKEYSVKALVNAVDHLGTVAYELNDLIAQQEKELQATELCASALAQRLRSCQEHSDREGLKQQSLAKTLYANHRHYALPDHADPVEDAVKRAGQQNVVLLRETFDLSQPAPISCTQIPQPQSPLPQTPPQQANHSPRLDTPGSTQTWTLDSEHTSSSTTVPSRLKSTKFALPINKSTNSKFQLADGSFVDKQPSPSSALSLFRGSFLNRSTDASFEETSSISSFISLTRTKTAGLPTAEKGLATTKVTTTRSGPINTKRTAPLKSGPIDVQNTTFMTPSLTPDARKGTRGRSILRSLLGLKK